MGFVFSIHFRHEGALALLLSLSYPTLPALVLLGSVPFREVGGSKSVSVGKAGKKVSSEGPHQPQGNEGGGGVGSSYSIWVASYLLASSY